MIKKCMKFMNMVTLIDLLFVSVREIFMLKLKDKIKVFI